MRESLGEAESLWGSHVNPRTPEAVIRRFEEDVAHFRSSMTA
jgi:hypothetical protein